MGDGGADTDTSGSPRLASMVDESRDGEPLPAEPVYLHTVRGVGYVFRRPA